MKKLPIHQSSRISINVYSIDESKEKKKKIYDDEDEALLDDDGDDIAEDELSMYREDAAEIEQLQRGNNEHEDEEEV